MEASFLSILLDADVKEEKKVITFRGVAPMVNSYGFIAQN